jgi:enamine deaminase RidA (YjgF/YER057c/UK114 family)
MVQQIIMKSNAGATNGLSFGSIAPARGLSFDKQVDNSIEQLCAFIFPEGETRYFIVQQTFFISAPSREEFDSRSALIRERLADKCGSQLAPTSIVAQSPEEGSEVVLELICSRVAREKKVRYKSVNGLIYCVVDHGEFRVLHATGLTGDPGDSIQRSAEKAFEQARIILGAEGLSFGHIVRQWNYVEDISRVEDPVANVQHYQVFNDVRSRFYGEGDFSNGYPAATGIGMSTGGVVIGFIAVSDSEKVKVRSVRNPRQVDAHSYSKDVLVGKSTGVMAEKCTPKFERGKMVILGERTHVYVSGTASIIGEKTMHPGDVERQTITTIENIQSLFARENQDQLGLNVNFQEIRFSHLRVYVKHRNDIPAVKTICESRLNCESSLYLESDICREELLVEIEGIFSLY